MPKLSEYQNRVKVASIDLGSGDTVDIKYHPRYLTKPVLEKLEGAVGDKDRKGSEVMNVFAEELAQALTWIDFQNEEGADIPPTKENLATLFDLNTLGAILTGLRTDIDRPTESAGTGSNSG